MHIESHVETLLICGRSITADQPLTQEEVLVGWAQACCEYSDVVCAVEGVAAESVAVIVVEIGVFAVAHPFLC